jgi:hypothetical protein
VFSVFPRVQSVLICSLCFYVFNVFVHVFCEFRFVQCFRVFIVWVFSVFVCSVFLRVQYVGVCVQCVGVCSVCL